MKVFNILSIDQQVGFAGAANGEPYDPQWSTLPVAGAVADAWRSRQFIMKHQKRIAHIWASMDTHRHTHIAHSVVWCDRNEDHPAPFTIITHDDVRRARWVTTDLSRLSWAWEYTAALEKNGKYQLQIWPQHCIIGTPGHNFMPHIIAAFQDWETTQQSQVSVVMKGLSPDVEMYSPFEAEVVDPRDPLTQKNVAWLQQIAATKGDILVMGEASSHCVRAALLSLMCNFPKETLKRFHVLTDCMSPVAAIPGGPDFPAIALRTLQEAESNGMTLVKSTEYH